MDRPGIRIAAVSGTAPEQALAGLLKQAELVRVATLAELVPLLRAGQVDTLASNRPTAIMFAAQVPGSRVLAGRFAVRQQRIVLAPGRSAASLALASDVTRQALASGLIRSAIQRFGIVGVQPAAVALPAVLPRTGQPGRLPLPQGALLGAGVLTIAAGLMARRSTDRHRPRQG